MPIIKALPLPQHCGPINVNIFDPGHSGEGEPGSEGRDGGSKEEQTLPLWLESKTFIEPSLNRYLLRTYYWPGTKPCDHTSEKHQPNPCLHRGNYILGAKT